MNKKKILFSLILCLCFAFCCFFVACNGDSEKGESKTNTQETETETTPNDQEPEDTAFDDELFNGIVFEDMTVEYDGAYHAIVFGGLPEDCIVEYSAGKGYKNVGEYTLNASVKIDSAKKDYSATLTIEKRALFVVAKEEVAYLNQNVAFEYGVSGFAGGDDLDDIDVKPEYNGVADTSIGVGTQTAAITFCGAEDDNYAFNYIAADLTVEDPAPLFKDGFVYYGKYPQSVLDDETLIATLDEKIAKGLLFADDDTGIICYDGNAYLQKTANIYSYIDNYRVFSDGTTAEKNASYYFKVEPIKWKILSDEDGCYITTEQLIEVRQFNLTHESNVWETSYLKQWLNEYFAQSAFGGITDGIKDDEDGKIRLLTLADVKNADYGFTDDASRQCFVTDYCIASGAFLINEDASGNYWLKDKVKTSFYDDVRVRIVDYNGTCEIEGTQFDNSGSCYFDATNRSCCIRPCLTLIDSEN